MVKLNIWQWIILAIPFLSVVAFLLIAAGTQIHEWGMNWIWGVIALVFLGWQWLLVRWTRPNTESLQEVSDQLHEQLESTIAQSDNQNQLHEQVEKALQQIIIESQNDPPIWEDWQLFWNRCQALVSAIAQIYHPETKYPLLNIYIPQVYWLMRGTMDDMDQWMQKLSPVLNQLTVGQAYRAYEVYRQVQPSAQRALQVWNVARWALNPVAALARQASQPSRQQANQQLIANLSQSLRKAALRNLAQRAIALYSDQQVSVGSLTESSSSQESFPQAKTETIQEILEQGQPQQEVEQKPVNLLLIGRTGAGKSSVINTLFQSQKAEVDVLPSTDEIKTYYWQSSTGDALNLWDTPGYEQVSSGQVRDLVLDYASNADLLLLVNPALDPALAMDEQFLSQLQAQTSELTTVTVVTQVDRLRPMREWNPPYDWQQGTKPKEKSIREATHYRREQLKKYSQQVFPLVTWDTESNRQPWNVEQLSQVLINEIAPAKQLRLARFLRDRESRSIAAAKIIDRYSKQMTTTQGITNFVKDPILEYISTFSTGSPALGKLLMEQIPVEDVPLVIGKLQMAYDLFNLLDTDDNPQEFDLRSIWSLLLDNSESPEKNAFAFGHALIAFWTQDLSISQLREQFENYLS